MVRISPSFIYAFLLTISTLGLLHIIFRTFVPEFWPLIYTIISFPLYILRTNLQHFIKFYTCIYIDKFYIGTVAIIFLTFVPVLWPLIYAEIAFLFNMLRTNVQNVTRFYICIDIDKI